MKLASLSAIDLESIESTLERVERKIDAENAKRKIRLAGKKQGKGSGK